MGIGLGLCCCGGCPPISSYIGHHTGLKPRYQMYDVQCVGSGSGSDMCDRAIIARRALFYLTEDVSTITYQSDATVSGDAPTWTGDVQITMVIGKTLDNGVHPSRPWWGGATIQSLTLDDGSDQIVYENNAGTLVRTDGCVCIEELNWVWYPVRRVWPVDDIAGVTFAVSFTRNTPTTCPATIDGSYTATFSSYSHDVDDWVVRATFSRAGDASTPTWTIQTHGPAVFSADEVADVVGDCSSLFGTLYRANLNGPGVSDSWNFNFDSTGISCPASFDPNNQPTTSKIVTADVLALTNNPGGDCSAVNRTFAIDEN